MEIALNKIVNNDDMEVPYLLPAIEGDYRHEEEGSGFTMDGGMINVEAPVEPFGGIIQLEAKLVV